MIPESARGVVGEVTLEVIGAIHRKPFGHLTKKCSSGSDRGINQRDDGTSCLESVRGSDRGVIGEMTQMVTQEFSGRVTGKLRGESSGKYTRNLQGR